MSAFIFKLLTFNLGQLINEEIERLLWSVDDQLLQEAFKQLVDLVVFKIGFDALLILKLLKLVHICFISS